MSEHKEGVEQLIDEIEFYIKFIERILVRKLKKKLWDEVPTLTLEYLKNPCFSL